MKRKKTKKIFVGSVAVGGNAPLSVQSMTNTDTRDLKATVSQIKRLERAGCDIARVAVPDDEAADVLSEIVKRVNIPVVADIHFNYRLALKSIEAGAACIRINPGNIGSIKRLEKVVNKAAQANIPIRVGINSGSLEKDILKKYGRPTAEALVESALRNIYLLEEMSFENIKVSIKSSDVVTSINAYRALSKKTKYPLHIGITEAGTAFSGTVKSSVGLGALLSSGIGDTMRVSLSADPVKEVLTGFEILKSLGLRKRGPELISCPTCARQQADVISIAHKIEKKIAGFKSTFKVAVMGCEVNGPGEAKEADVGLAGSKKFGVIFKKGRIIKKVPKNEMFDSLLAEVIKFENK